MERPAHAAVGHGDGLRRLLRVSGVVQGVGFRPYVWRLARGLGLAGWVRNDPAGVEILVEGAAESVGEFTGRLPAEIPPLASVRDLDWQDTDPGWDLGGFEIVESGGGAAATMIGHDTGVCPDCLAELFDPTDRRWRYAFVNCTYCGPRYTLTRGLPYDRSRTSMAAFPLCLECEREYRDPADRRFHAEPTACPVCGPSLWVLRSGEAQAVRPSVRMGDPIAEAVSLIEAGQILAIKGLGGFHLACDARNTGAVERLRALKDREEKPFALMAANPASIADWVETSESDIRVLESPERPICLLRKRRGADEVFPGIAPGLAWLGFMLPYTPIHWLLFHEAAGRPVGTGWTREPQPLVLVMTSANPGGEPLAIDNDEAIRRLSGIADAFLLHDREIVVRCDDSVVRAEIARPTPAPTPTHAAGGFGFVRRARGFTPRAIRLPRSGPPVLALGGWLKDTLCVTRGDEAFLSQHIGGLDNPPTCGMLAEVCEHLLGILEVEPRAIAHDLHPDFFSTRHALDLAGRWGVPALAVQHHQAHIAAVAADSGWDGPVLGLALDGVGLGTDGAAWGGELLALDGPGFERIGHLAPLELPGGDRAAREPWRMAAAVLHRLGRTDEIPRRFPNRPAATRLAQLLDRGLAPPTTSLGRWLDAAAGLLGVREIMAYEGQAAMLLEGLAERHGPVQPLSDGWRIEGGRLDLLPLFARLADERDAALGAALCHATLAQALADWAAQTAAVLGLRTVALGGGCFLNHILTQDLSRLLAERGIAVLSARQAPPNDGGLSLGQAWVAMQSLAEGGD